MAMNRPKPLQIYDPVLSNLARSYRSHGFIARDLLPDIPVSKLSGQYPVFTKSFWFQNDVDNLVADRSPAREIDWEWSTETYFASEFALKVSITELEREQALDVLRLETGKMEFLTQRMELAHEIRVASLLLTSTQDPVKGRITTANTHVPSNLWDTSTGDPEKDFKQGALAIYDLTGFVPNTIVLPYKVAYALAVNTNFRTLLRYDAAGKSRDFIEVGDRVVPSVIHGMNVIIPQGAQVDSSKEGGSQSISEIWGKHVRLLNLDKSAGWGNPSVAYLMRHTPKRVTRWAQTDPDVEYVREMERYDLKVVAPDTGYVIASVIS